MRKYFHVLNIGIQNQLVYRVNFLFRACFGLLPLIAMISVWRTIYRGHENDIGGYTLAQMISYYLVVTLVDMLTAVNEDDWQIAADIREGARSTPRWRWCRWRFSSWCNGSFWCCRTTPRRWVGSRFPS